jgi:predicted RecB family nuclease
MTFLEQVTRAENGEFQMQVRQAAVTRAIQIMDLAPTNTPEDIEAHRKRTALAREVLLNANQLARAFAPAVASNPGLAETYTDGDLQYTLNTYWDAFAGIVKPPIDAS